MKRAVSRAFREWKEEFGRNWQRLNAFMRIVLGIVLAMIMIWCARRWLLDPMQQCLVSIREENAAIDMPNGIIRPQSDVQIQESHLRAESLSESLNQARNQVARALEQVAVASPVQKVDVLNRLDALISSHHLLLRNRGEIDEPVAANGPVPIARYHYSLTGSFADLRSFLHALNRFEYLSWFDGFELTIVTDMLDRPRRVKGQVCLQLSFDCTLYFYDGGRG